MSRRTPAPVIDKSDTAWHHDRKVPIALIPTLITQTAGIVSWGATMSARITSLEEKALVAAPLADRLTRQEERLDAVKDGITEIKSILRKEPMPSKSR